MKFRNVKPQYRNHAEAFCIADDHALMLDGLRAILEETLTEVMFDLPGRDDVVADIGLGDPDVLPPLEQAGQKAPVFAKVAGAVTKVVESNRPKRGAGSRARLSGSCCATRSRAMRRRPTSASSARTRRTRTG